MLGLPYRHIHQQASSFSPSFQGYLTIQPQRQLYGIYGRGSVDYGFDLRTSGATGGVTEVRRDNFGNGIAQNMVQLEACLIRLYISLFSHISQLNNWLWEQTSRKRKHCEMAARSSTNHSPSTVYGAIIDSIVRRFLECAMDNDGNITYRLSGAVYIELLRR